MRSVPHLQEALVGEESDARKHGKIKTVSETGETVFATPADKTVWKSLSPTLQSAVVSWRRKQLGSRQNYHVGQLVDLRSESGLVPVIVCRNIGKDTLSVVTFGDRSVESTVPLASLRKHSGLFVISEDVSNGLSPRPVRCVNEVDSACVIEDSLMWVESCTVGPGAKAALLKVKQDDTVACTCATGRGCFVADRSACVCASTPLSFGVGDSNVARECSSTACSCACACGDVSPQPADVEVFRTLTGGW